MAKRKTDIRPPSKRGLSDLEQLAKELKDETPTTKPVKVEKKVEAKPKPKATAKKESKTVKAGEKRDRAMYYCDSAHLRNLKIHAAIEGKTVSGLLKDVMNDYMENNKQALGSLLDQLSK